jgi:hypothetical protein
MDVGMFASATVFIVAIFFAAVGVVLAVIVGRDALRRGVEAPWAWTLATLFSWFAALVYVLLRDELPQASPQARGPAASGDRLAGDLG